MATPIRLFMHACKRLGRVTARERAARSGRARSFAPGPPVVPFLALPVVDVAQLVELQVVALAAAGSSPVVHPRPPVSVPAGPDRDSVERRQARRVNAVRVWRNW